MRNRTIQYQLRVRSAIRRAISRAKLRSVALRSLTPEQIEALVAALTSALIPVLQGDFAAAPAAPADDFGLGEDESLNLELGGEEGDEDEGEEEGEETSASSRSRLMRNHRLRSILARIRARRSALRSSFASRSVAKRPLTSRPVLRSRLASRPSGFSRPSGESVGSDRALRRAALRARIRKILNRNTN